MSERLESAKKESGRITLKVSEALGKDAGRGLARLDPRDMERLHVSVGDIVQIRGNRASVAKVMPAFQDARGKETVQIDGITRSNAGVGIGEKVFVEKASARPASKIVLVPADGGSALRSERDMGYVGKLLDGLPLVAGDRVRAILLGSRFQDFTVLSTIPKDAVLIHPGTLITLDEQRGESSGKLRISYEDIGGLEKAIQKVREIIELPLKYPQVFERLGIDPPKGVLLHGPPGCGKTLLARAVANETEAYFTDISGPEIMGKFYGESEARLRSVFEDAQRHTPSIIFIDELDAIAPKREEMGGEKQVERRVVAQLLALMDGLEERGKVVIIGATNLPNLLDPALRRPGRFDREIVIGIPSAQARLGILEIHTRGMPLSEDVKLPRLAEITHGFTGADLAALCREAAMIALRRVIPHIDFELESVPYELLLEIKVSMEDLLGALREVEPSALREVFVEVPNVGWEDVGGLKEVKERLREAVEWPLKHPDLFEHAKIKAPKGVLLHGLPGTGKTLLAKALASEIGVNFISVKGPQLLSKFVGESERGVREIFRKARQASPAIIFFDELDAIVPVRGGGGGDSHVSERVVSQLLTEMDGIEELKGVWVLAATNRLDLVDPALLRPGRFDVLLKLSFPDEQGRLAIFQVHTRDKPLADDVDLTPLVKETEQMTGAEIEALCRQATMLAIRRFLQTKKGTDYSSFKITKQDFEKAAVELILSGVVPRRGRERKHTEPIAELKVKG